MNSEEQKLGGPKTLQEKWCERETFKYFEKRTLMCRKQEVTS